VGRLVGAVVVLVLLVAGCADESTDTAGAVEPTGRLSVHPVLGTTDAGAVTGPDELDPTAQSSVLDPDGGAALVLGPAVLSRDDVGSAAAEPSRPEGPPDALTVEWTGDGAVRWTELTGAAACAPPDDPTRRIAVLLDGVVLAAPVVSPAVQCGVGVQGATTQLLGPFGSSDAEAVAALLQPGA
jgi:SecD/SecF fusion protein